MKYWEPNEDGIFYVAMCAYKAPDKTHATQRDILRQRVRMNEQSPFERVKDFWRPASEISSQINHKTELP